MFANLALPLAAALLLSTGVAFAEPEASASTEIKTESPAAESVEKPHTRKPHALHNMDENQDGHVSPAEAEEFSTKQFDLIDDNKDGFITTEEMSSFHHSRKGKWAEKREKGMGEQPGMTPEMVERMKTRREDGEEAPWFAALDPDGDGKVAKADFLTHSRERHGKMDLNGDGDVTKEEIKERHQKKREGRQSHPQTDTAKPDIEKEAPEAE